MMIDDASTTLRPFVADLQEKNADLITMRKMFPIAIPSPCLFNLPHPTSPTSQSKTAQPRSLAHMPDGFASCTLSATLSSTPVTPPDSLAPPPLTSVSSLLLRWSCLRS